MKKYLTVTVILVVMLALLTTFTQVAAQDQEMDPESVIRAILGALDAGDAEMAVSYAAEDAVIVLLPPALGGDDNVVQGKEAIGEWWGFIAMDNSHHELWDFHVDGNKATWKATIWGDYFRNLGMKAPLEADCVGIVEDGLLQSYTWKATDESMTRLEAATTQATNTTLATRFIEELWNQGELTVADEIVSEDFVSHSFPFPGGDREALKESVASFRAENPDAYFTLDDIVVTENQVFVQNSMMTKAEGATEGEPAGPPMMLVLGVKDGKITDRWLYMSP